MGAAILILHPQGARLLFTVLFISRMDGAILIYSTHCLVYPSHGGRLVSNPGQGSKGINFSGWHGLDMSVTVTKRRYRYCAN